MSIPGSIDFNGCSVLQSKSLLDLGAEQFGQLSTFSSLDSALPEVGRLLGQLGRDERERYERLLAEVCDTDTPFEVLRATKDAAKQLVSSAPSQPHRDVATLLYHASIAAAFARHRTNISSRLIETRSLLYEGLAATLEPDPIALLFRQALDQILASEEI